MVVARPIVDVVLDAIDRGVHDARMIEADAPEIALILKEPMEGRLKGIGRREVYAG